MGSCWCDVCKRHEDECDCELLSSKDKQAILVHLLEARRHARSGDDVAMSEELAKVERLLGISGSTEAS
jgi:hypothetical protein